MSRRYYKRRYNKRYASNSNLTLIIKGLFYLFCLPLLLFVLLIKLIFKCVNLKKSNKNDIVNNNLNIDLQVNDNHSTSDISHNQYSSKNLVTDYEKYFLNIIDNYFGENYRIIPQVPLSSIVDKSKTYSKQYQSELYRTIDIGIFNKETFEPLLMIEINDKSHAQVERYKRDLKVREILKKANIPLLTFYSGKPNQDEYILDSIKKYLNLQ